MHSALKGIGFNWVALFSAFVLLASCQSEGVEPGTKPDVTISAQNSPKIQVCGESMSSFMQDQSQRELGNLSVFNDAASFHIQYALPAGLTLVEAQVWVGEIGKLPVLADGTPDLGQFPKVSPTVSDGHWSYQKPIAALGSCADFSISFLVKDGNGAESRLWPKGKVLGSGGGLEWCVQKCASEQAACQDTQSPGQFVTYSLGDWLQYDPAKAILEKHFAQIFPLGLEVGCRDKWVLADIAALVDAYPMDATPRFLEGSQYAASHRNTLVDALLALNLNIAIDHELADFSPNPYPFADLQIAEGPFSGWTVADIQLEANQAVGNCTSNYSPQQLLEVLSAINANFANGKVAKGFLVCP